MRVTLLYNARAGTATPSEDDLRALLEATGHEVEGVLQLPEEGEELSVPRTPLLVVAGGDGTVRTAALSAASQGTPIAILPLGTANNLATSLGVTAPLESLVMSWHDAAIREVDIGIAHTRRGEMPFLEGAGAGALADLVRAKASGSRELDRTARLARAWARFEERLSEHPAIRVDIRVDDAEFRRDAILVEVLNTPRVGPGVEFAPLADPSDGLLDVVALGAGADGARGAIDPDEFPRHVETFRGRRIEVRVPETSLHVDGHAYRTPGETWRASTAEARLRVLAAV